LKQDATIILVGGPMTLDDGSVVDSRQTTIDDEYADVYRKAMGSSEQWWVTVSSVVDSILESSDPNAFALILGPRSLVEIRPDGSLKRRRLSKFLRGGVGNISVAYRNASQPLPEGYRETKTVENHNGLWARFGVKLESELRRWMFSDLDFGFDALVDEFRPAVIVDTTNRFARRAWSESLQAIETEFLLEGITLILPHTAGSERFLGDYERWCAVGRPDFEHESPTEPIDGDWNDRPILHYAETVAVDGSFAVTGLVRRGSRRDPSNFEAARSLLQTRFDLKIGIWDLEDNPILRASLLKPEPIPFLPTNPVMVPTAIVDRASNKKIERDTARRKAALEKSTALQLINESMTGLSAIGWPPLDEQGRATFPLSKPVLYYGERKTISNLLLFVDKRRTTLTLSRYFDDEIKTAEYLANEKTELATMASQELLGFPDTDEIEWFSTGSQILWRRQIGWADQADWQSLAKMLLANTPVWQNLTKPLVAEVTKLWRKNGRDQKAAEKARNSAMLSAQRLVSEQIATVRLLVFEQVDPEHFSRFELVLWTIRIDWTDLPCVVLMFQFRDTHKVFVRFDWNNDSLEVLSSRIAIHLGASPENWIATWHDMRKGKAEPPSFGNSWAREVLP
jgi:hypothetical protein